MPTVQEANVAKALHDLAVIGAKGKLIDEDDIVFRGTQIILPEMMTKQEAIRFLRAKEAEEEQETNFHRTFKYRPWDGARALNAALRRAFGAIIQTGTPGMWGDNPPNMLTIPVSATETEQIPWGCVVVPHLPGVRMYVGEERDAELGPLFEMMVQGPRKYKNHVDGIFALVERELQTNSLYRGKAFDGQVQPDFIDLRGVDPNKLVYTQDTLMDLEANIWSLLRFTDQMEAQGISLKRAVLLEGKYGTGKTEAAKLTALYATQNGHTFIMCRPGRDKLRDVMATARLYQPSVVFFEDVDTVADVESKNVSELLDLFDGIQAKGTKIMCVLTTNHVDRIHKGMCRPGRLDAIINIGPLDAAGIRKLVEVLVEPDKLAENLQWELIAAAMEGYVPAFCVEAIGRAKRYNLSRNACQACGGSGSVRTDPNDDETVIICPACNGERTQLTKLDTADFVAAAHGLRGQYDIMNGAKDGVEHDPLSRELARVVHSAVHDVSVVDGDGDERYTLASGNGYH